MHKYHIFSYKIAIWNNAHLYDFIYCVSCGNILFNALNRKTKLAQIGNYTEPIKFVCEKCENCILSFK